MPLEVIQTASMAATALITLRITSPRELTAVTAKLREHDGSDTASRDAWLHCVCCRWLMSPSTTREFQQLDHLG